MIISNIKIREINPSDKSLTEKSFSLRPWYSPKGTYLQLSNQNYEIKECDNVILNAQIVSQSKIKGLLHIQVQSGQKVIFSGDYNIDRNALVSSIGDLNGFIEVKMEKDGKINQII